MPRTVPRYDGLSVGCELLEFVKDRFTVEVRACVGASLAECAGLVGASLGECVGLVGASLGECAGARVVGTHDWSIPALTPGMYGA